MTVVFLNFSGGAKTRSWQHLPRFISPFLKGPYASSDRGRKTRTALMRVFFCHMVFQGNCAWGRKAHVIMLQI